MKNPKDKPPKEIQKLKGFEELLDYFKVSPREKKRGGPSPEGTDFELYNKFASELTRQELLANFFGEKLNLEQKEQNTQALIKAQRENRDKEIEALALALSKEEGNFQQVLEHLVNSAFSPQRPPTL